MDVHTVGDLAGHPAHPGRHGRHVYLDLAVGVLSRGPCWWEQRQFVIRTAVVQGRLAPERRQAGLDGQHVIAQPRPRRLVHRPITTLDVGLDLAAQSEPKSAAGVLRQFPSQAGGDHGTSRKGHRDSGAQLEARGRLGGHRQRHPWSLAGLGEKQAGEARPLDGPGQLGRVRPRRAADRQVEMHVSSPGMARTAEAASGVEPG